MLSGQSAWPGREVDTNSANISPNAKFVAGSWPVLYILTDLLTRQINVFSIHLIRLILLLLNVQGHLSSLAYDPYLACNLLLNKATTRLLPKPNTPILTILQHSRIYLELQSIQEKNGNNMSTLNY